MDVKLQIHRGNDPADWDQRKSEGQFKGAAEGVGVKTLAEFRTDDDLFTNPDRLDEFIQPGDNIVSVINRALAKAAENQPGIFQHLATAGGFPGEGPLKLGFLVYDND